MAARSTSQSFMVRRGATRLVLIAEQLWPVLWPLVPALIGFCALSLLNTWSVTPGWLHALATGALFALTGWTVWRLSKAVTWPSRTQVLARLERANALSHQPLRTAAADVDVHANAQGKALWQAHQARLAGQLRSVRPPKARLSWLDQDIYCVLPLVVLLFATGLMVAGLSAPDRLVRGFIPSLGGAPVDAVVTVEAAPPTYTGLPPLLLTAYTDQVDRSAQQQMLPSGTTLTITHQGGWRTPKLKIGGESIALKDDGDDRYKLTITAPSSDGFKVTQGAREHYRWNGLFVQDEPPAVAFSDLPERTKNDGLSIVYDIFDDYGVESLELLLIPRDFPEEAQKLAVTTPKVEPGEQENRRFFKDLSASKWAGQPVYLTLVATDGLKQDGRSGPTEMILPERRFTHPLAIELIELRKRLFFESGSRVPVSGALNVLSLRPDDFGHSLWTYSMLRSAHYRLRRHDDLTVQNEVTDLMWQIATFLEDGGLSQGREDMRQAIEDMMSALEQADAEQFDALAQQLEAKMADMIAKQMRLMEQSGQSPQMQGGEMRMVDSSTLARMMQQMRDLAASGDMAAAMQMLEAIQSLMENLTAGSGPSKESLEQAQAAQEALDDINALIQDQRALMNETVRQALDRSRSQGSDEKPQSAPQSALQSAPQSSLGQGQPQAGGAPSGARQSAGQPGQTAQAGSGQDSENGLQQGQMGSQSPGGYAQLGQDQSALESEASRISRTLDEKGVQSPEGLPAAGSSMSDAASNLGEQQGLPALRHQADALRHLETAQKGLEEQLNQMMQQIRQQSAGRDPFGRADGRSLSGGQVKIPTEADAKKVREIRDELQKRLGQPGRSKLERSYLKRLLERFSR